jgi:Zn-dependent peptidase ImmA (M78 family)
MRGFIAARKLLSELRWTQWPVSITELCETLGFELFYDAWEGSGGASYRSARSKKFVIVINDSRSLTHQRFSGAHEVGHLVLKHEVFSLMDDRHPMRKSTEESEADHFAAELLMPKFYLHQKGFVHKRQ